MAEHNEFVKGKKRPLHIYIDKGYSIRHRNWRIRKKNWILSPNIETN